MITLTKYFIVTEDDTALKIGSGGLEVLSTPSLISWMENVSFDMCESKVNEYETTVGIEMIMKHSAPTAVGEKVKITSTLEESSNIFTFTIKAFVGELEIGTATHKRAKVNKEAFLKKVYD